MTDVNLNSLRNQPDERGRFGMHGGRFVAETLMPLILELEDEYRAAKKDPAFNAQMETNRAEPVPAPASEPIADPVIEFRRERVAETTPEPAADAVPEAAEEDLSAVFYRKFVKEAV